MGALIIVDGNKVGQGRLEGDVIEVMATPEPAHYRVRWSDGHESIFFSDARVVVKKPQPKKAAPAKKAAAAKKA